MSVELKEKAYSHIRRGLLARQWEKQPFSLRKVAKSMGMSYMPVRDAVAKLKSEGFIEIIPRVGIRPKNFKRQEIIDLFDIRMYMESGAVELATPLIDESQLSFLDQKLHEQLAVIKRLRQIWDGNPDTLVQYHYFVDGPEAKRLLELNTEIHEVLINASGNEKMAKLVNDMHLLTGILRGRALLPGVNYLHQLAKDYAFHYRIIRAIRNRNASLAGQMMRNHISDGKKYHIMVFDWLETIDKVRNMDSYMAASADSQKSCNKYMSN